MAVTERDAHSAIPPGTGIEDNVEWKWTAMGERLSVECQACAARAGMNSVVHGSVT